MSNEARRKLLTEYAVALVAERQSWERLCGPGLAEADRYLVYGEWKQSSASLKDLVRRLRSTEPGPEFDGRPTAPVPSSQEGIALIETSSKREKDGVAAAAPPVRLPVDVRRLAGSLRLAVLWCARSASTLPRVGAP